MRALERAVVRAAIALTRHHDHDDLTPDKVLAAAVEAYLGDEARKDRPGREACGHMSPGWSMFCQRPAGHPDDSDKPHEGFDTRGYRRHWKDW